MDDEGGCYYTKIQKCGVVGLVAFLYIRPDHIFVLGPN